MCGRYTNTAISVGSIRDRFELNEEAPGEGLGRANVSPTPQMFAVVRDRDEGLRLPRFFDLGISPRVVPRGRCHSHVRPCPIAGRAARRVDTQRTQQVSTQGDTRPRTWLNHAARRPHDVHRKT
jgi:hypothetical protein